MATFVGAGANSGLGLVMRRYAWLVGGHFIEYGQDFNGGTLVAMVLPVDGILRMLKYYSKKASKCVWLTVCETETVHEDYRRIFELGDEFYVMSEYCIRVLSRQFPHGKFKLLRTSAVPPSIAPEPVRLPDLTGKYVFYHIGNIIDQRKNIKALIECFMRAQVPNSVLLLKATCNRPVDWRLPNVVIVQDLLTDGQMETIHQAGHCYVSMAHSEGAGMGAIEAAMRHKPVIVPEYGATKEYVPGAMFVRCSPGTVTFDDFLFKEGMEWGNPDPAHMVDLMRTVPTKVAHPETHRIMSQVPLELLEVVHA